ncbi:hypothetical protein F4824DRAFT_499144 [Ustulina deusta]|nr:hypothetical protein F4824DRAFT_499144 [Ustulina deusta]
MSGFEIAGVVLGAYPILYEAAKDLRGVMKKDKCWWFFEREFDDFVSGVYKEYVSFSLTLEFLLEPLDLTPDERRRLQDERDCILWHEAHVQTQLKRRIQAKYHVWFMEQLAEMKAAVHELHDILPFRKVIFPKLSLVYLLDSTSVEAELFKLKSSFSSRKTQLLAIVRDKNDALYYFLEKASQITRSHVLVEPSKSYYRSSMKKISLLQSHSQRAFHFLQRNWSCNCLQPHHYGITVQDYNTDPSIGLLLSHEDTLVRVQLALDTAKPRPDVVSLPITELEQTKLGDITSLKQQMYWKRQRTKFKAKIPHSILSLGVSTLSFLSNLSLLWGCRVQLEKVEAKLKKKAPIPRLDTETPGPSLDSGYQQQVLLVNNANTESHTRRSRDASQQRVRFDEGHTNASISTSTVQHMGNICDIATESIQQGYSAYGDISQDTRIHLRVEPRPGSPHQQSTVEDFILSTPRRDRRLQVALAVLRSILYLGTSPWVPHPWNKSHLVLIGDQSTNPCPYFSTSSLLSNSPSASGQASEAERTRESLFATGVLILELLFRETLERQPFRNQFLNNDGQVTKATDLCAALEWHQRVDEEYGYDISDAIRRCIVCAFDPPCDLRNPHFITTVNYGVLRSLENFLSAWNNDPARR